MKIGRPAKELKVNAADREPTGVDRPLAEPARWTGSPRADGVCAWPMGNPELQWRVAFA